MRFKRFICFLLMQCLLISSIHFIEFSSNNSQNPSFSEGKIDLNPNKAESGGYGSEWYRTYGTLASDYCRDMALSSSGNIHLVGDYASDIRIVKYSSSGSFQWTRTWNNGGNEDGNAVATDSSGNIYAAGSSGSDICLIKYSSGGTFQWSQTLSISDIDQAFAVAIDSSNYIYIAGESYTSGTWPLRDFALAKYSSSGSLQWTQTLDLSEEDTCNAIAIDSSNNIYLGGTSRYGYGGNIYFTVVKYSNGGSREWSRTWNTGSATVDCEGICLDPSNNIYLAGRAWYGSSLYQMLLVKFNSGGTYQWNRKWGNSGYDEATDITYDSSGFVYLGGGTTSLGAGSYDFCVVKYSTSGVFQDIDTWGGSDYDKGNAIDIRSGKIYMGGSTKSYGAGNYDFCVVKLNPAPEITINSPTIDQPVGKQAPYYDVDVIDSDIIEKYYRLNGGSKHTFGSTGYIDQSAWKSCDDGPVIITFYARDPGGTVYEEVTVQKDTVGPNITVLTPSPNEIFGNISMEFEVSIEDNDHDSIWYSLNGGWNITVDDTSGIINQDAWGQLNNGSVTIRFYANDSLNNIEYEEVVIQKDLYSPFIYVFSPTAGGVYGLQSPEYNILVPCITLDTVWYSINNSVNYTITEMTGTLNQTEWALYGNGSLIIKFFANNSDGIINLEQFTLFKDTTVPNITIINPSPFQVYGNRTFSFKLSITNTDYTDIWYTINGSVDYYASSLSDTVNLTLWESFTRGSLLIEFYAKNSLGYIGVSNITIVKDLNYLYPKNAYAIIIGIENYPGSSNDLSYCKDDAIKIRNLLINGYNFYSANIISLYDSAASRSGIYNAFSTIQDKIYPNDIFFFYYSGHGGTNGVSSQYICPYNSIPSNPSAYIYDTELDAQLDLLNTAQKYILIDSCYSGGMINEGQASGRIFMSACGSDQLSYETPYLQNGIFTHFFFESYFDAPDINMDDIISMEEHFYYTKEQTILYSANLGVLQVPSMYDGINGWTVLYPELSPISASIIGNQINYSFTMYGQGKIDVLNFTVCSTNSEIVVQTQDILGKVVSIDGFGIYSGSIKLLSGDPITGYEAYAVVSGYRSKIIRRTYGDSDGDGLCDLFEYFLGGGIDPRLNDSDNDGLDDYYEYYGITNPIINDTDSDGILDGVEVNFYGSNPLSNDSDSDNLSDAYEAYTSGTSLTNTDSDFDELSDYFELFNSSTNPLDNDSDDDNLLDGQEVNIYGTNPNLRDTDGDGHGDGWEVENGHNPLDPNDPIDEDKKESKDESSQLNVVPIILIFGIIGVATSVTAIFIKIRKPKSKTTEKFITTYFKKPISPNQNNITKKVYIFPKQNFCTKCGFKLGLNNRFCTNCGIKNI